MKISVQKKVQLTGHNASIYTIQPFSASTQLLSAAGDGWIVKWDVLAPDLGKLIAKVEGNIFSLLFLKKENWLVAGNMYGGLHWIDLKNNHNFKNIAHHQKGVFDLKKIDQHLYTLGGQGMLSQWNIATQQVLYSYQLTNKSLRSIDYSVERQEIAIGASDWCIYILNAKDLTIKHIIKNAHDNSVFSVKYAPNGKHLWSGGRDAHLKIWDLETFKNINAQPAHWYTINHITFDPSGRLAATASRDKTIKIWDTENFKLLKVIDTIRHGCHINSVNKLLWSSHDDMLLSCSDDRSIIGWEIKRAE